MAEIDEVRKNDNPELELAGIVVNRVRSVAEEHQYREHELVEIYGRSAVMKPLMPERIAVLSVGVLALAFALAVVVNQRMADLPERADAEA